MHTVLPKLLETGVSLVRGYLQACQNGRESGSVH